MPPRRRASSASGWRRFFGERTLRVEPDDGILADAAAGSDYVKVRTGAKFSPRDIDILEVHEGWVHVATSLNGQAQPVAKWLAKGPPRTTAVQEGLAALLEMFTFRTYPRRARRLNDRVLAVDKAEDGASFLDVFEWFRTEGYEEDECFHNARRVFRGGVLEGGAPFTKDACYCKGIVLNYAFIRSAIQHDRLDLVPLLFVGKVAHEDVPVLARRVSDGVVKPPRLPASDVPRPERPGHLDGVLHVLLPARRRSHRRPLRPTLRLLRRGSYRARNVALRFWMRAAMPSFASWDVESRCKSSRSSASPCSSDDSPLACAARLVRPTAIAA